MRVHVPPPLHSYTSGVSEVACSGATLAEVLAELETKYPGIRFRMVNEQDQIRPHIRFFVAGRLATVLSQAVGAADPVHIICALSGG